MFLFTLFVFLWMPKGKKQKVTFEVATSNSGNDGVGVSQASRLLFSEDLQASPRLRV
jgi:hypothetical protein